MNHWDNVRALEEGWALDHWMIVRRDMNKFFNNFDAASFVWKEAMGGSFYHRRAILALTTRSITGAREWIRLRGTYGWFKVDLADGEVFDREHTSEYDDIVRIDLDTLLGPFNPGEDWDILFFSFWTDKGEYDDCTPNLQTWLEVAELDGRAASLANKVRAALANSKKTFKLQETATRTVEVSAPNIHVAKELLKLAPEAWERREVNVLQD